MTCENGAIGCGEPVRDVEDPTRKRVWFCAACVKGHCATPGHVLFVRNSPEDQQRILRAVAAGRTKVKVQPEDPKDPKQGAQ